MDAHDPIEGFLRELKRELRAHGRARRRILAEVRAHLLDVSEAEQSGGVEEGVAAQRAVLRFGLAAETAREFNGLARRRGAVLRRALVPWLAAVAVTSTATATVYASHATAPPQHALAKPAVRGSCAQHSAASSTIPAQPDVPQVLLPKTPGKRAVCVARDATRR